ncbi:MAG: SPOR domain-containing protein [Sphingobium sp.]|nr:SPOR domain-containing protein [Sphingobium sp.]
MTGDDGDGFLAEDRDRLPWLEPAEPIEEYRSAPIQKIIGLVVLGLILLGIIIGGGWWLKHNISGGTPGGEATMVTPDRETYKIPANSAEARKYDVEGKNFEGEGDAAFEASSGGNSSGRIDPTKAPEVPMTEAVKPEPKPAAKPAPTAKPEATPATPAPAPSLGGARVQIGAYNSKAIADEAFKRLVKRFDDLAGTRHAVEPVPGKTLYRLRLGAADRAAAAALCGRLRVAGENCFVVP